LPRSTRIIAATETIGLVVEAREDCVSSHRVAGILVAETDGFEAGELAVTGDAEHGTGHPARLDLGVQHVYDLPQLPAR
jgi:hypothetical protein